MRIVDMVCGLAVIWLVAFVVVTMLAKLGVLGMKRWFLEVTRNRTTRPAARLWNTHKKALLWMIVGGILTVALLVHNNILVLVPSR